MLPSVTPPSSYHREAGRSLKVVDAGRQVYTGQAGRLCSLRLLHSAAALGRWLDVSASTPLSGCDAGVGQILPWLTIVALVDISVVACGEPDFGDAVGAPPVSRRGRVGVGAREEHTPQSFAFRELYEF